MSTFALRPSRYLTIAAVALLTAGCTTTATDGGSHDTAAGDDSSSSSSSSSDSNSGAQCPVIAGYEYFSDSSITKYPEAGQLFGDGTAITFEGPAEYYPLYTLYYVDEKGEPLYNSGGGFSQEAPVGVFTTDLLVFGEEANDRPGILELDTVYQDGMVLDTIEPTYQDGVSIVTLGRYCLTLKAS